MSNDDSPLETYPLQIIAGLLCLGTPGGSESEISIPFEGELGVVKSNSIFSGREPSRSM